MSSIIVLVLFSLCGLDACRGRLLSVNLQDNLADESLRGRSLHPSNEVVGETRYGVTTPILPQMVPSSQQAEPRSVRSLAKPAALAEAVAEEPKHGGASGVCEEITPEEAGRDGSAEKRTGQTAALGAVRTESIRTVSWPVPRDPHRGHPGFNVDYDPPQTHPSHHH